MCLKVGSQEWPPSRPEEIHPIHRDTSNSVISVERMLSKPQPRHWSVHVLPFLPFARGLDSGPAQPSTLPRFRILWLGGGRRDGVYRFL